jgi:hypothetical protein
MTPPEDAIRVEHGGRFPSGVLVGSAGAFASARDRPDGSRVWRYSGGDKRGLRIGSRNRGLCWTVHATADLYHCGHRMSEGEQYAPRARANSQAAAARFSACHQLSFCIAHS